MLLKELRNFHDYLIPYISYKYNYLSVYKNTVITFIIWIQIFACLKLKFTKKKQFVLNKYIDALMCVNLPGNQRVSSTHHPLTQTLADPY